MKQMPLNTTHFPVGDFDVKAVWCDCLWNSEGIWLWIHRDGQINLWRLLEHVVSGLDWIEQGLTSPPTQYRLKGEKTQPTASKCWRKSWPATDRKRLQTHQGFPTVLQVNLCKKKNYTIVYHWRPVLAVFIGLLPIGLLLILPMPHVPHPTKTMATWSLVVDTILLFRLCETSLWW